MHHQFSETALPKIIRYGIHDMEITIKSRDNRLLSRFERAGYRVNAHRRAGRRNGFILRAARPAEGTTIYARAKPQDLLAPDSRGSDLLETNRIQVGVNALLDVIRPLAGTESAITISRVDLASDAVFPTHIGRHFIRSIVEHAAEMNDFVMKVYCDPRSAGLNRFSNLDWSNRRGVIEWRLYDRHGVDKAVGLGHQVRLERQINMTVPLDVSIDDILGLYGANALVARFPHHARFGTPSLPELQSRLRRPLHVDRAFAYFAREAEFGPDSSYPKTGNRRKTRNDLRQAMRSFGVDPDSGISTRLVLEELTAPFASPATPR